MISVTIGSVQAPRATATACIIWMHGLGAESMDMEMLVHSLPLSDLPLKHVFLNAPIRPVALNGGMEMRAWYDIAPDFSTTREDEQGVLDSTQAIHAIIDAQVADGIPAKAIGLAGFSQGGAMALHAGLHYTQPLAGIVALSAYLPLSLTYNRQLPQIQTHTPIFMGVGLHDKVVHIDWSKASYQHISHAGYTAVDFHAYSMEHAVCMDETRDLSAWIRKYFAE